MGFGQRDKSLFMGAGFPAGNAVCSMTKTKYSVRGRQNSPEMEEIMTGSEKIDFLRSVKATCLKESKKGAKANGKMSARERIGELFDEGSFIETGALMRKHTESVEEAAQASSEGVVTGYGTVNGRLTFVYAQDPAILNGAVSQMHAAKIIKVMELAAKAGAPLVGIVYCGGGLLEEGIGLLDSYGAILAKAMEIKNAVPHITLVAGYCPGISAIVSQISDFVVMSEKDGKLYMQAGQTFGIVSEEYGSAKQASSLGLADLTAPDDLQAIAQVKTLLDYLPDNVLSDPPETACDDDLNRTSEKLDQLLLEEVYDACEAVKEIGDNRTFLELKNGYAPGVVTGLIRINGRTVGVVASQPKENEGRLTVEALKKTADFVSLCDGLNIPVITLVNTPGYCFGPEDTKKIIDAAADCMAVYQNASVPKITVVAGKAYGSAYLVMGSSQLGADLTFALPGAEISVINPKGGADIFFASQIAGAKDPYTGRQKAEEKFKEVYSNPYVAAAKGMVDDVVEPNSLRPILASGLEMLYAKIEMES